MDDYFNYDEEEVEQREIVYEDENTAQSNYGKTNCCFDLQLQHLHPREREVIKEEERAWMVVAFHLLRLNHY